MSQAGGRWKWPAVLLALLACVGLLLRSSPPSCPSGQGLATGHLCRVDRYSPPPATFLQLTHFAAWPMTSEQAAQLIDDTLDLVHQRLQELEAAEHQHDQKALAAEFREWRQPLGGHIDLMVCPGFPAV